MDVEIIPYHSLPCECEKFIINGIEADKDDFGTNEDLDPEHAEEYACANNQFIHKLPTDEVLKKYSISLKDYSDICDMLYNEFSVGDCGWCI